MELLFVLFLVVQVNFSECIVSRRCLENFRIANVSSRSITVAWDYACTSEHDVTFKVYYEHRSWNACNDQERRDEQRGRGRGNTQTTNKMVVLADLHPFSLYSLSMKALARKKSNGRIISPPEELNIIGETLSEAPTIAPLSSPHPTKLGQTSLVFFWRDPPPNRCPDFNGLLDGTYFLLKGMERWNEIEIQRGMTTHDSKMFENLQPFSSYKLFLYNQDNVGKFNDDYVLTIPARTAAAQPLAPRDLIEPANTTFGTTRVLEWLPPYPPRGQIRHYTLRWKKQGDSQWSGGRLDVEPSPCSSRLENDFARHDPYEMPVCQQVENLPANEEFVFQVSATNLDVLNPSPWSKEFISRARNGKGFFAAVGSTKHFIWIIILSLFIVIIVLLLGIAIYLKLFRKRRGGAKGKTPYIEVPVYESRAGVRPESSTFGSPAARSSFTSSDTLIKYQTHFPPPSTTTSLMSGPCSIQSQPLPEVPPQEHTYEELKVLQHPPAIPEEVKVPFADEDEEVFSEGDYLAPRTTTKEKSRKASVDTLDIDDYLKPTFNQAMVNTTDMSPPSEDPPPIPKVSYSVKQ